MLSVSEFEWCSSISKKEPKAKIKTTDVIYVIAIDML